MMQHLMNRSVRTGALRLAGLGSRVSQQTVRFSGSLDKTPEEIMSLNGYNVAEEYIRKYGLDQEANPDRVEALAQRGLIPRPMADYFKSEIDMRDKSLKNGERLSKQYYFFLLPVTILIALNAYLIEKQHLEHLEHHPEPYVPYSYLRIRNSKFFFGDGDHSLFENPKYNYDPKHPRWSGDAAH